jgi:hypothetical protein
VSWHIQIQHNTEHTALLLLWVGTFRSNTTLNIWHYCYLKWHIQIEHNNFYNFKCRLLHVVTALKHLTPGAHLGWLPGCISPKIRFFKSLIL